MKIRTAQLLRWWSGTLLLLALQAQISSAGTVIKLDLANDSSTDVALSSNTLRTVDDGIGATTGDQNTSVIFLDALAAEENILFGSFTLDGVNLFGTPFVINNSVVMQPTQGGHFKIYNQNNVLILSGSLTDGTISGPLGANNAATGGFLTTTLGSFDGGTLLGKLAINSASLAFSLTNVNEGNGFNIVGEGNDARLGSFTAHATANLGARAVPEPSTTVLAILGLCGIVGQFRRRRG